MVLTLCFNDLKFSQLFIISGDWIMTTDKEEKEWTEEDWTKRIGPVVEWMTENADSTVEVIEDTIEDVAHQVNIGNNKPHRRKLSWAQILLLFRPIKGSPVGHNKKVYAKEVQEWFDDVKAKLTLANAELDEHEVMRLVDFRTQTIEGQKMRFQRKSVSENAVNSKLKKIIGLVDDGEIEATWDSLRAYSQEVKVDSDV